MIYSLMKLAFDAGMNRMLGSHDDFEQTHADFNEWMEDFIRSNYNIEGLAKLAYDENRKIGGESNFGEWDEAPECVRDSHMNLTFTVIKRFITAGQEDSE